MTALKKLRIALFLLLGLLAYRAVRLNSVPKSALETLRKPRQMVVYSIDPDRRARFEHPGATFFHNFRILGESAIASVHTRRNVAKAVEWAVILPGREALCF